MVDSTSLMMNGMQQFADANGVPYLGGKVFMEIPNTNTPKATWVDMEHSAENTYPIDLDAAGRCVIWGTGIYRQRLLDINDVEIWDKITISLTSSEDVETIVNNALLAASFYDLALFVSGKPIDGATYVIFNVPRLLVLAAELAGCIFTVATNPTGSPTWTLYKNGISIGTITFDSTGAASQAFPGAVTFSAGDQLSIVAPTPQDATGAFFAFTFVFDAG